MSGISFSGLATGLPPGLVDDLIQAERAPVFRFQQRIRKLETADRAWGDINTKISGLRAATDKLTLPTDYNDLWKVTSSNEDAIAVASAGTPTQAGSLSFTVQQLAQRQSQSSADTFTGLDADIGGRTLTVNGTAITPADNTLQGLVDAVNGDETLGVEARAVQVTPGSYQLQLTAAESGVDNAFTVTSSGWTNPFVEVQEARNAVMDVDGLAVERASNTFDDLVDGVSITLKAVTADPVQIGVARDIEAATERITAFVDGLNDVLAEIATKTAVGAEGSGSTLTGDVTARRIASQLTNALLRAGESGGLRPYDIGIEITREGTFTLDESKLTAALEDDFAAVQSLFTRASGSSSTGDVRLQSSQATTPQGDYTVNVVTAATKASLRGTGTGSLLLSSTLDFTTSDGGTASVTIAANTSVADAVDQINAALEAAGIETVRASDDGGRIALAESRYGSHSFTVTSTGGDPYGIAGTATGEDVVVEVNGQQYTGDGRTVTTDEGLSLEVAGAAGATATVTVAEGLAGLMDRTLDGIEGTDGSVARARGSLDGRIDDYNDRIEVFERRLAKREEALRRQFANLESLIGQMNSTSQWLASQIAGLPKPG